MARDQTRPAWYRCGVAGELETAPRPPQRRSYGSHHHELPGVVECGIWAVTERQHRGCTTAPPKKRCGEARILAQQDPLICLWDGKRDPDTQTGACPTQTDRCWGVEPQAPAVLLDPFVDLSSICRPDHRRDGAQYAALPRLVLRVLMSGIITKGKNLPWDGAQECYHWRHWPIVQAWLGRTESVIPENRKDITIGGF